MNLDELDGQGITKGVITCSIRADSVAMSRSSWPMRSRCIRQALRALGYVFPAADAPA